MRKAHPILFSDPMVRALMDGRKTQTRRVLKSSTEAKGPYNPAYVQAHIKSKGWKEICPYGKIGDLLYVREAWAIVSKARDFTKVYYRAHENCSHTEFHKNFPTELCTKYRISWPKWKPSIHMPRLFSRITLEIKDIRVESLHDINMDDAMAEGIGPRPDPMQGGGFFPMDEFEELWKSINGEKSWQENPYVWVLEFKVHKANIDNFLKGK